MSTLRPRLHLLLPGVILLALVSGSALLFFLASPEAPVRAAATISCDPADIAAEAEKKEWEFEETLGVPALGPFDPANGLEFLGWLFFAAMAITAVLALTMIVVAGVQYIAGGMASSQLSKAKQRMQNSFLGLVLALASILILFTINPNLTQLQLPELPISQELQENWIEMCKESRDGRQVGTDCGDSSPACQDLCKDTFEDDACQRAQCLWAVQVVNRFEPICTSVDGTKLGENQGFDKVACLGVDVTPGGGAPSAAFKTECRNIGATPGEDSNGATDIGYDSSGNQLNVPECGNLAEALSDASPKDVNPSCGFLLKMDWCKEDPNCVKSK